MRIKATIITVLVSIVIYVAIVVYMGLRIWCMIGRIIDHEQMEQIFFEDYDLLVIVADYFIEHEGATMELSYHNYPGEVNIWIHGIVRRIPISDEAAAIAAATLRKRRYSRLRVSNNIVLFQRWSTRDRGRGIAFSRYGFNLEEPLPIGFTIIEPLSRDGWFFYETR